MSGRNRAQLVQRNARRDRIVRLLREADDELSPRKIASALGAPRRTIYSDLRALVESGKIEETRGVEQHRRYDVVDGREADA
jgi:DeoR/GlpR family transcriptional regulator of sugar metabolism